MSRWRAVGTIWLLGLASALAPAAEVAPEGLPADALRAIEADDWPAAARLLAEPAKDARNAQALYWLGLAKLEQGDGKASEALEAALRTDPTWPEAARMLARSAALRAADTKTPPFFVTLATNWGFDAEVQHYLGMAWARRFLHLTKIKAFAGGEDPARARREAIRHLELAADLGTAEPENDRYLAFLLDRQGRPEDAATCAQRAIRGGAGYEMYVILGNSLVRLGRAAEASRAYAQARKLAPGKAGLVEFERGKALLAAAHYNQAVEAFVAVLDLNFAQANVRHYLGAAAFGAANYPLALWAFQQSHMVDGIVDDLYYQGRCAGELGCYAQAQEHIEKALAAFRGKQRDKDALPPSEWVHYLGRAEWRLGKRDAALTHLKEAFDRAPGRPCYARWLYRAQLAADDVVGAIRTCRQYGEHGHAEAAIAALHDILKKWPLPRLKDLMARRPSHHLEAYTALGDLHHIQQQYRSSAYCYQAAKRTSGPRTYLWAAWSLTHSGRMDAAEQAFRDYIAAAKDENRDFGRYGLGCVLLHKGAWALAREALAAITRESMALGRDAGLFGAALGEQSPEARSRANLGLALGLVKSKCLGHGRGVEVLFVIPGSPLAKAVPAVRTDDVLLSVGAFILGSEEELAALREAPLPEAPVEAWVRRATHEFPVKLDFRPVAAQVAALPPLPQPRENQP